MSDEAAKRLVSHAYQIVFDLGNGRTIQATGNLFADEELAASNARLDTIVSMLERQRARAEIETLELELKARYKRVDEIKLHIDTTLAQIQAIESKAQKRPGDGNSVQQLTAALETHKLNLKRMEPEVADGLQAIEDAKRKAA